MVGVVIYPFAAGADVMIVVVVMIMLTLYRTV